MWNNIHVCSCRSVNKSSWYWQSASCIRCVVIQSVWPNAGVVFLQNPTCEFLREFIAPRHCLSFNEAISDTCIMIDIKSTAVPTLLSIWHIWNKVKCITHSCMYRFSYKKKLIINVLVILTDPNVLHHCVDKVIFLWSSWIMECTCMLFTFEFRSCARGGGASVM